MQPLFPNYIWFKLIIILDHKRTDIRSNGGSSGENPLGRRGYQRYDNTENYYSMGVGGVKNYQKLNYVIYEWPLKLSQW